MNKETKKWRVVVVFGRIYYYLTDSRLAVYVWKNDTLHKSKPICQWCIGSRWTLDWETIVLSLFDQNHSHIPDVPWTWKKVNCYESITQVPNKHLLVNYVDFHVYQCHFEKNKSVLNLWLRGNSFPKTKFTQGAVFLNAIIGMICY